MQEETHLDGNWASDQKLMRQIHNKKDQMDENNPPQLYFKPWSWSSKELNCINR